MPPTCVIFGTRARAIWSQRPLTVSIRTPLELKQAWKQPKLRGSCRSESHSYSPDPRGKQTSRFGTKAGHWIVMGRAPKPIPSEEAERARNRSVPGRSACFYYPDGGACCSARIGRKTPRDDASPCHHQSMEWLWLGLASGAQSLEPVARDMGSAALRSQSSLRHLGSLRWLGRSLR
jgi:hypothetical protein